MNRQPRMPGGAEGQQDFLQVVVDGNGDDVGTRYHHVADAHLAQAEDVLQHQPLLRREIRVVRIVFEGFLDVVADRGLAETEDGAQPIKKARPRRDAGSIALRCGLALAHRSPPATIVSA